MKLSISNIGWYEKDNIEILNYLTKKGFDGLEIAPTILLDDPYNHIAEAQKIVRKIHEDNKLEISSMQSIWYGQSGNIFDEEESRLLLSYTKKAIDFASAINCRNIVFGCPKNRVIPEGKTVKDIVSFFKELGDYAFSKNTIIAMEPNPTIYNTNFINYTSEAFDFVKLIDSKGFKVNVDFGTIIENQEDLNVVIDNLNLVNHIHISEPYLEKINKRIEHVELAKKLKENGYDKYVSIEMKKLENIEELKEIVDYVYEVFN